MARLFGTDGVRGEANSSLKPELAFRLGRAATLYFGKSLTSAPPTILIGRDTRLSGAMLEAALVAGITSAGGSAVTAGIIPTPAVAYLTKSLNCAAGIVISASHNPFGDNGIKFFGGDGYKLPDATEDELQAIVEHIAKNDDLYRPTEDAVGSVEDRSDLINQYIDFICATAKTRLTGLKVVLDCANGAAYEAMPRILRRLGANVKIIHALPNGVNINDKCGSTHLSSLQRAVVENRADIGIAHDGDADRCLCVDENGEIIDGDHIIVMCALNMMKDGTLKDNTVVTTVMANIGFHEAIKAAGGKVEVTAVGDRYVLENMLKNGYRLGGEQSGHIIFTDYATTGDGLLTGVKVLESLKKSGKKASELAAVMTTYPQLLVNVRVEKKDGWENNAAIKEAIAAGEKELGDSSRILVRASGTEPLIRVMAEGKDSRQLNKVCNRIADVIKNEQG